MPPDVYVRRPRPLPFPFGRVDCVLFAKGRQALFHGLRTLGPQPGETILVPAYNCGSEVEAIVAAGFSCRFYEGVDAFRPDEAELDELLGPQVRALHLIHYLGFPQDVERWRHWCDRHGLLLIEDAAQSWLSSLDGRPLGTFGDLSIFALYKTLGLPHGAALIGSTARVSPDPHVGALSLLKRHAAWALARSDLLARAVVPRLSTTVPDPLDFVRNGGFGLGELDHGASRVTPFLIARAYDDTIVARRRTNYMLLLERLADLVPEGFHELPDGVCPLAFPIESPEKRALLQRLADAAVNALDFWSVPHPLMPAGAFPRADARRRSLVALPVHHELGRDDVLRIASAVRPARRRPALMLHPLDDLDRVDEEWAALAARSRNVFATQEWLSTWWKHFGDGRSSIAATCRDRSHGLVAVLPVYMWRKRPVRIGRFIGHGAGDELGPLCDVRDRPQVARALRDLMTKHEIDVLVGEHVAGAAAWRRLAAATLLRQGASPVLTLSASDWPTFLSRRSANLRQQIRRRERRVRRAHDVRVRLTSDAKRLDQDLNTLFALHRARWRGKSTAFLPGGEDFHREFAALSLSRGWLRLWIMEIDEQPAAAWYGFRYAGVDSYYQAGRDPSFDPLAVGFVLLCHTIRDAFVSASDEYRFLRGGEAYKLRFADSDRGLETIGLAASPIGRLAVGAASGSRLVPRLPAPVRAALEL